MKKIEDKKGEIKNFSLETCVCCGVRTEVSKELEISKRKYYIEGAGQLCSRCFFELYRQ